MRRHWNFFTPANGRSLICIPTFCKIDAANDALMQFPDHLLHIAERTALAAHLHDPVVFFLCSNQQLALAWIMTAGLFHVHMLACLQCHYRSRCMPVIRSCNHQGIQVTLFHQPADIFEALWFSSGYLV